MSQAIVVSRPTRVQLVSGNTQQKKKKKPAPKTRSRKRGRASRQVSRAAMTATAAYISSLVDPFDNPPGPMGFGCLTPTTCNTAYFRGVVNSNGDGTLTLAAVPNSKKLLYLNNAGAAVATWTTGDASDQAVISSNFDGGRCVSIGIRAFPSIAATAVPGVCVVGALPFQSVTSLTAMTTNDLITLPTSHIYRGYEGGSSTGRPVDPSSWTFRSETTDAFGYAGGTVIPFTIPYVAFSGFGAASPVYVEVIMNFESMPNISHQATPLNPNLESKSNGPTLSDEWPNVERMWNSIRGTIPTPGQPGEGAATAWNLVNHPMVRGAVRGAAAAAARNPRIRPYANTLTALTDSFFG